VHSGRDRHCAQDRHPLNELHPRGERCPSGMDQFARIVIGYHGCPEDFARDLLLGVKQVPAWQPSTNDWDWLGHGIYFWEHSPERARRWAQDKFSKQTTTPAVIGAVIQLGRCFDLLDEAITATLASSFLELDSAFARTGRALPQNR